MSITNAQAALQAAATAFQPMYGKTAPQPQHATFLAGEFKRWLDGQDAIDRAEADIASKGTLDQRVTRLEEQAAPVPASAHVANGGAR